MAGIQGIMASIRKSKKILKKYGYEIIRSNGSGKFTVLTPVWKSWIQIFGIPTFDIRNPSKSLKDRSREENSESSHSTIFHNLTIP